MADLRPVPFPGPDPKTSASRRQAKASPLDAPCVRTIRQALGAGGRMTSADLRGASALPRRTVYRALQILREGGLLHQRGSLHDSRQTYFWLADAAAAPESSGHGEAVAPPAPPAPPTRVR